MKALPGVDTLARIGHTPTLMLRRVRACSPARDRAALEAFIGDRFAARHGACLRHFMPDLLGLEDGAGRLHAAVGLRDAASGPLFLERYLDRPIETEIRAECGDELRREKIVEVGNLAALGSGQARSLIVALTDLLVTEGFEWVAFTGTTEVFNSFRRLGLSPLSLGKADSSRMGDELADWGSYYESNPQVMIGKIRCGHEQLSAGGLFHRLGHQSLLAACGAQDVAVT